MQITGWNVVRAPGMRIGTEVWHIYLIPRSTRASFRAIVEPGRRAGTHYSRVYFFGVGGLVHFASWTSDAERSGRFSSAAFSEALPVSPPPAGCG